MTYKILGPKGRVIVRAATLARVKKILPALKRRFGHVRLVRDAAPTLLRTTMYDSVNIGEIPADAKAVAGYVGGRWPTAAPLAVKFPHAHVVTIAVAANENALCLDVEQGDATVDQASAWVKRQLARGVKRPIVYTSVAQAHALVVALQEAGIKRSQVRLWTAHYTNVAHLCSNRCGFEVPGGADATQYDDHALGRNLDVSLCSRGFWR